MHILDWLVTAYAPLLRRWTLVDGSHWHKLRAEPRVRATHTKPQPLWTGIYL